MKAQDGVYCLPGSSTRILRLAAETELWGPHFSEAPRRAKQCKAVQSSAKHEDTSETFGVCLFF